MTIDEAIKVLGQHNITGVSVFCEQLISEKVEYERLLKAAVEDLNSVGRALEGDDILCMKYIACKGCPFDGDNCSKWRYADEALKLIGDTDDGMDKEVNQND